MEKTEEFFKNKTVFTPSPYYDPLPKFSSKKFFNPEDYSIDFLKEKKTKPICYYLFSYLNIIWYKFEICLHENGKDGIGGKVKKVTEINYGGDLFLWKIDRCFDEMKADFCYQIPTKPFRIMIVPIIEGIESEEEAIRLSNIGIELNNIPRFSIGYLSEEDESDEEEDESNDEEEETINTDKSFKLDECVICLTNPPNVLLCNCGHLCLCGECEEVKSLKVCPVCKFENTIKRMIE